MRVKSGENGHSVGLPSGDRALPPHIPSQLLVDKGMSAKQVVLDQVIVYYSHAIDTAPELKLFLYLLMRKVYYCARSMCFLPRFEDPDLLEHISREQIGNKCSSESISELSGAGA